MKQAMIVKNKAHWIFEYPTLRIFPPGPSGEEYLTIDLTGHPEVQEGWDYDPETGQFSEPIYIPPEPGQEPEPIPHIPTQLDNIEELLLQKSLEDDYRFTMLEMNLGI